MLPESPLFCGMWQRVLISLLFAGLTIWLGWFVQQSEFISILTGYALFFALYLNVVKKHDITYWIGVGITLRVILLFSFPNFSDDIYRFYWDGLLSSRGYNPFNHLPDYYIQNNILPEYLTPELYEKLNSKEYYTIYPPVLQAIFAVAAWLFPKSIIGAGVVMKLFLLGGEIGSILLIRKLLKKFNLPEKNVLLYALNPLIIIEIMGNLHFEGLMIFCLLLALWWLVTSPQPKLLLSAMGMAFSIASKLLPLMLLPFLITKLTWRRSVIYFSVIGMILLIMFTPLVNHFFLQNFSNSLNLYFRRFEFNASVFYILQWIGYELKGKNLVRIIGPILATLTFLIIIILTIVRRNKDWSSLPESWLFAFSIYLLNTTTVHPWYITLPLALSVLTNWRYPIVWSGAVVLSYSHYWGGGFEERYGLIGVEYALVMIFFFWEYYNFRLSRNMAY